MGEGLLGEGQVGVKEEEEDKEEEDVEEEETEEEEAGTCTLRYGQFCKRVLDLGICLRACGPIF